MSEFTRSTTVQQLLDLIRDGHPSAADALVAHAQDRVRRLARRMFRRRPDLRAAGDTDDVLQAALVRLHRSLARIHPADVRAFFGLAAQQVRWALGDMARELATRPDVVGGDSGGGPHPPDPEGEPATLLAWAEFHQAAAELPDDERECFDLLFYQGLTQDEAAAALGVAVRTVKRRWRSARLLLYRVLHGEGPDA